MRKEFGYGLAGLGIIGVLGAGGYYGYEAFFGNRAPQAGAPAKGGSPIEPTRTPSPTSTPEPTRTVVPTATPFVIPMITENITNSNCPDTKILVLGARYINNPNIANNAKLAGPADIAVGESPKFSEAMIVRKEDLNNPKSRDVLIARAPMIVKGDYSQSLATLNANSNTPGKDSKPSLAIQWYFENDKEEMDPEVGIMRKPRYKTTITCGNTKPVMGGRLADVEIAKAAATITGYKFRTLGAIMESAMKQTTGKSAGFSAPDDFSANTQAVLKFIGK